MPAADAALIRLLLLPTATQDAAGTPSVAATAASQAALVEGLAPPAAAMSAEVTGASADYVKYIVCSSKAWVLATLTLHALTSAP
jgi:hypothetical protein